MERNGAIEKSSKGLRATEMHSNLEEKKKMQNCMKNTGTVV